MSEKGNDLAATRGDIKRIDARMDGADARMDRMEAMLGRVMTTMSQLVGTIAEMRVEMRETFATKAEVRDLRSSVDAFAGQMLDFRRQWAYQSDGLMRHEGRLDDHDRRLGKIESRLQ